MSENVIKMKMAVMNARIFQGKIDFTCLGVQDKESVIHACKVVIYKSVPAVTVWHHSAYPHDAKQ